MTAMHKNLINIRDVVYCTKPFGLLLLNNSVTEKTCSRLKIWWERAVVRVCVDGATNGFDRLMRRPFSSPLKNEESLKLQSTDISPLGLCNGTGVASLDLRHKCNLSAEEKNHSLHTFKPIKLPHFICGDFDSIQPALKDYYASIGVKIIHTPNQDETDFTKALRLVRTYLSSNNVEVNHLIAAISISDERFDHVIANINVLYKKVVSVPVVLVAPNAVLIMLEAGHHKIVPLSSQFKGDSNWCSYAPIGRPAIVTTSGFKWDVEKQRVEFGGLVSTSNEFIEECPEVHISTDEPLLFMCALPSDLYSEVIP